MDYATLVADIEATVENNFETTDIDRIIQMAEKRIYDFVELPAFTKEATTALTTSNRYFAAPADYRTMASFAIVSGGRYYYLLPKQQDFILEAYPTPTDTGRPAYYALYDADTFILGPTPDSNYSTLMTYYYYPESITTANTTWLGDNFPLALFKACLLEAAVFLKEEQDVVKLYDEELGKALGLMKNFSDGRLQADNYRNNHPRTKVA